MIGGNLGGINRILACLTMNILTWPDIKRKFYRSFVNILGIGCVQMQEKKAYFRRKNMGKLANKALTEGMASYNIWIRV